MSSQIWLTFAPVADKSAQYLKVSLEEINWLSVVFMVVAIPVSFGTTWMLDTLGLRITVQRSLICIVGYYVSPEISWYPFVPFYWKTSVSIDRFCVS